MNPQVDAFLAAAPQWRAEMTKLREIALRAGLTEELKWAKPCYSHQGHNVLIIQPFKATCALLFTKGALLADPHQLLEKPGENTQAARRIPFTALSDIERLEPTLLAYIQEAVAAETDGRKVDFPATANLAYVAELQQCLVADPALRTAFTALTPGRQRAYNLHFAAPKQTQTRFARIEKCRPQILAGRGLNDR